MYLPETRERAAEVLDHLRRIVRALRVTSHEVERELGISGAQLFVLRSVAGGEQSMRELAETTLTDPSSVSVVVARLVARRLVVRRQHPVDARRALVSITARGQALLARAPEPVQIRLVAAVRGLSPTRLRHLSAALAQVTRTMGIEEGRPPMFDEEPDKRTRDGG